MKTPSLPMLTIGLATALCSVVVPQTAQAATRSRSFIVNATGACQAALPAFEGQIRKRPLAVQNEGTTSAFVNCSFTGTDRGIGGSNSISSFFIYADNNTGAAVNLTCTLVDGISGISSVFIPKTETLEANSKLNELSWSAAADNGGLKFEYVVNASCNLPVGVGLTASIVYYDEDVGG